MQDPTVIRELVGTLGAPGALAGLAVAFYFGAKSVLLVINRRNGTNGGGAGAVSYKDAAVMTDTVKHDVDVAERTIMANIDKTRHDVNGGLANVLASLQTHGEKQTDRLVDKLDGIAELIKAGNERRRDG